MKFLYRRYQSITLRFYFLRILFFLVITILALSCEDFVEVEPPETSLIGSTVFENDINATAAMLGIYTQWVESSASPFIGDFGFTQVSGTASDELLNFSSVSFTTEFEENEILDDNGAIFALWNAVYRYIYTCNSIIEGLNNSTGVSEELALQLEGEAKFVRAWCYFYLVNLWGGVPLVTITDFETNAFLSRASEQDIYNQIITDLTDAEKLLEEDYQSDQRTRPNKAVARFLKAKTYLYQQDWLNAETIITSLIEDGRFSLEEDLNNVFRIQSQEAIWQLESINPDIGTVEAQVFVLNAPPRFRGYSLRPDLINVFETGDLRREFWVGEIDSSTETFYFPFKYQEEDGSSDGIVTQYSTVFRLAEAFLIRAEVRAQQGDIIGALEDINRIRTRANLDSISANDQASVLLAIEKERRTELFTEWSNRWFDLKRTDRSGVILSPLKPGWEETDVLWPIPLQEFLNNPNIGEQNPGY